MKLQFQAKKRLKLLLTQKLLLQLIHKKLKKEMDASEYGGAPLLGLSRTVIKAHGSSDAKAFRNAIRQATECVENHVTYEIAKLVVPELIPQDNGR